MVDDFKTVGAFVEILVATDLAYDEIVRRARDRIPEAHHDAVGCWRRLRPSQARRRRAAPPEDKVMSGSRRFPGVNVGSRAPSG